MIRSMEKSVLYLLGLQGRREYLSYRIPSPRCCDYISQHAPKHSLNQISV